MINPGQAAQAHRRYHDVDTLRFLAAVGVMLLHYLARGFSPEDDYSPVFYGQVANFVKYNYLAVNLFFMISGFVILMSSEDAKPSGFLRSRFLRLYPAYWFCCTVTFILTYVFVNHIFHLTVARYVLNMSMLNGFFGVGFVDGVYWTLLVELKFYLLILLVLLLGKMRNIEWVLAAWLLLSIVQIVLDVNVVEKYLITNFASFFIAGCLFYRISKRGFSWSRLILLVLTIPVGIHYEWLALSERAAHFTGLVFHGEMVALICLSFYVLFVLLILPRTTSASYARFSRLLGSLSYPIYLIHMNVGMVLFNLIGHRLNKWVLLALIISVMIAGAYLINRYVERPLAAFLGRHIPPVPVKEKAPSVAEVT
ncbi:acyltransferase family protein [Herbaspirillum huttiense]|uniref:acyltransferase family protein n=1 Tax=Herbaspirillum huttiense TaxID=863372 RepID=UPI0039B1112B